MMRNVPRRKSELQMEGLIFNMISALQNNDDTRTGPDHEQYDSDARTICILQINLSARVFWKKFIIHYNST